MPNDTPLDESHRLKAAGVVGLSINTPLLATAFYDDVEPLLDRLTELDLFANVQVQGDDLTSLWPMIERSGARVLRSLRSPDPAAGLQQSGFQTLLELADSGRVTVNYPIT